MTGLFVWSVCLSGLLGVYWLDEFCCTGMLSTGLFCTVLFSHGLFGTGLPLWLSLYWAD